MPTRQRLDAVDRALVRALQEDGRMSYADLAARVGLSAPAVRQRVQRLVDGGVMHVVAVTDPRALGRSVLALVGLRVDGDVRAVAQAVAALDPVVYLVTTAGSFDLFAEVAAGSLEEVFAVVNDRIRPLPGVHGVQLFPYVGGRPHRVPGGIPD